MDNEFMKELAINTNNIVEATAKPYQQQIESLKTKLEAIREAATKWPRCCDQWQDGLGGMHCKNCSQKTFAMFDEIQRILGIDKGCNPLI